MKRYLLLAVISIALLAACTATTPTATPPTLAASATPAPPSGAQAAAIPFPITRPKKSVPVQSAAPLPPGVPFEQQQLEALRMKDGVLHLSVDKLAALTTQLREALGATADE